MATLTAVYDACVLYPAPLRDLLMHLALVDLFRARWTDTIHEEWIGSVLAHRADLERAALERTRDLMNANVLDCLVNPPKTVDQLLDTFERLQLPESVSRLRRFAELL